MEYQCVLSSSKEMLSGGSCLLIQNWAWGFFLTIQSLRCGTTGVVTFIRGNMLHVAWLGDSQVMLVRKGQAVELMKPHKPDREVRRACAKHSQAVFTADTGRYQPHVGAGTLCIALSLSPGVAADVPLSLLCLEVGVDLCAKPLSSSGRAAASAGLCL